MAQHGACTQFDARVPAGVGFVSGAESPHATDSEPAGEGIAPIKFREPPSHRAEASLMPYASPQCLRSGPNSLARIQPRPKAFHRLVIRLQAQVQFQSHPATVG
jgi:hypothetical protein